MSKGFLLVLSGASGAGKSTILSELFKIRDDVCLSVSATTRSPRPGEVHGENYYFISHGDFREMLERGEFLEHAEYVSNFYGTPAAPIERLLDEGKCVILEIEVKGARQIRQKCPEAVQVFIAPKSFSALRRRLVSRNTEPPEILEMRIAAAREEYGGAGEYDYIVLNEDVAKAVRELDAIITAERCRTRHRIGEIMEGID